LEEVSDRPAWTDEQWNAGHEEEIPKTHKSLIEEEGNAKDSEGCTRGEEDDTKFAIG
jgi:hypothetical protein